MNITDKSDKLLLAILGKIDQSLNLSLKQVLLINVILACIATFYNLMH